MWHCDHMATRTARIHPEINRTDLATKIGADRSYLSHVLNGTKKASLKVAVSIFEETGIRIGPLVGKTGADIKALAKATAILGAA